MKNLLDIEERLNIKIRLIEPLLGTVPKDPEVYKRFIASKAPDSATGEQETETVEEIEEGGWTGFHRDEKGLFIYNYMIKGFLKSACEVCMATGIIKKIPAYKKWFDLLVFVEPRRISLGKDKPDGNLERPLRAMTAMGPRVTVCRSDYVNAGTEIDFTIRILKNPKISQKTIKQILEYGRYVGLGQWRGSGGYGKFEVVE